MAEILRRHVVTHLGGEQAHGGLDECDRNAFAGAAVAGVEVARALRDEGVGIAVLHCRAVSS